MSPNYRKRGTRKDKNAIDTDVCEPCTMAKRRSSDVILFAQLAAAMPRRNVELYTEALADTDVTSQLFLNVGRV